MSIRLFLSRLRHLLFVSVMHGQISVFSLCYFDWSNGLHVNNIYIRVILINNQYIFEYKFIAIVSVLCECLRIKTTPRIIIISVNSSSSVVIFWVTHCTYIYQFYNRTYSISLLVLLLSLSLFLLPLLLMLMFGIDLDAAIRLSHTIVVIT